MTTYLLGAKRLRGVLGRKQTSFPPIDGREAVVYDDSLSVRNCLKEFLAPDGSSYSNVLPRSGLFGVRSAQSLWFKDADSAIEGRRKDNVDVQYDICKAWCCGWRKYR